MSETFIRLKPRDEWRPGYDKERLIDEMRASLTEIPGVRYNFSQPIKDNVEEAVSGVRGKVVLKIFGTDLDADARRRWSRPRRRSRRCPASSTSTSTATPATPQLQVALDRAGAGARRHRRWRTRSARSRPRSPDAWRPPCGRASARCRCA